MKRAKLPWQPYRWIVSDLNGSVLSFGGDLVLYLSRNATKIIQASRWEQGEEYVAVTNRNASGNNSR